MPLLKSLLPLLLLAGLTSARPTTQPVAPATDPAQAAGEARPAGVEEVAAAVAKLRTVRLTGEMVLLVEAAGESVRRRAGFTTLIDTPTRYRHEVPGELLIVRGEGGLFVHFPKAEAYLEYTPEALAAEPALPGPVAELLREHDPLLLLVIDGRTVQQVLMGAEVAADPAEAAQGPEAAEVAGAAALDDAGWPPRFVVAEGRVVRAERDLSRLLVGEGVPRVEQATLTVQYDAAEAWGQVPPEAFSWTPPRGARRLNQGPELLQEAPATPE